MDKSHKHYVERREKSQTKKKIYCVSPFIKHSETDKTPYGVKSQDSSCTW